MGFRRSQSPLFLLVLVFTFVSAVLLDRCWTSSTASQLAHVGCCCPHIQFAGIVRLSLVRVVWTFGVVSASSPSAGPYSLLPLPRLVVTPHAVRRYRTHHSSSSSSNSCCCLCLLHHRLILKSEAISSSLLFPDCPPKKSLTQAPLLLQNFLQPKPTLHTLTFLPPALFSPNPQSTYLSNNTTCSQRPQTQRSLSLPTQPPSSSTPSLRKNFPYPLLGAFQTCLSKPLPHTHPPVHLVGILAQ